MHTRRNKFFHHSASISVSVIVFLALGMFTELCATTGTPQDKGWTKDKFFGGTVNFREKASRLYEKEQFIAAGKTYKKMTKRARSRESAAWALHKSAKSFLKGGHYSKAFSNYKESLNKYPNLIPYHETLQALRTIGEHFADTPKRFLGMKLNRTPRAIDVYRLLIRKAPSASQAPRDILQLGSLERRYGKKEKAVQTFKRLIRKHSRTTEAAKARVQVAELLLQKGDVQPNYFQLAQQARDFCTHILQQNISSKVEQRADALSEKARRLMARYYYYLADFYASPPHLVPEAAYRYCRILKERFGDTKYADKRSNILQRLGKTGTAPPPALEGEAEEAKTGKQKTFGFFKRQKEEGEEEREMQRQQAETIRKIDDVDKRLLPLSAKGLPEFDSISVGRIINKTRRARLGAKLRNQLREQIMTDATVDLAESGKGDIRIGARIKDFTFSESGSTRLDDDLDEDRDAYQTNVFETAIVIEYRVIRGDNDQPAFQWREISTSVDYPRTPDLETSRSGSFQRVLNEAARKIIVSITEAW